MSGEKEDGGHRCPTPCPGAAQGGGAPGMGVAPSGGPPMPHWYFSAPNIPEKINIKFLGFFEKLYFRGNSRNLQFLESRKTKSCKGGNPNQIITTKILKYFNRQ